MLWMLTAMADPLTLGAAWERAIEHNLEIQAQRRANDAARWNLMEARGAFDPQLSMSVNVGGAQTPTNNVVDGQSVITSSDRRFAAGIRQELPTGGRISAQYSEYWSNSDSENAASNTFANDGVSLSLSQPLLRGAFQGGLASASDARLAVREAELRWRAALEQLVLDVAGAYWGLLSAREQQAIAERGVTLAEDHLAETLERQKEGFAGSGEVLQVQVSVGRARRTAVEAEASAGAATLRLSRILGLPLGTEIEIVDRPEVGDSLPTTPALLELGRAGNAQLALARIGQEQAKRSVRRARNSALPDLGIDASASLAAGGTEAKAVRRDLFGTPAPSWGVGLNLGLPLFLRENRARMGLADVRRDRADYAYAAAEQDLHLRVDGAVRNLTRDRAALEVAEQTLGFARASLAAQKELLKEGRGSNRDVIDALESLRGAEASELDARIACQRSQLAAERVAGTLLDLL